MFQPAGLVALCAIPVFFIQPLFGMVVIGLAVTLWFSTYYAAFDYVKKRKKIIEAEIPRFALTITQNLEIDRDVLKILTSYRRVAGKEFGQELDQTIADMKKEAAKRPKKIQRYSMMMLICIIIIYAVVLCMEVIGSIGVFFG